MTPAEAYGEYIHESRRKQIDINASTVRHVERLLRDVLAGVQDDLRRIPRGIVGTRYKQDLEAALARLLGSFGKQYKSVLDAGIQASAANVAQREYRLLSAVVADRHAEGPERALTIARTAGNQTAQLGVEFGRVPTLVLDRLYARVYPDGLKLSDRLGNLETNARRMIADEVYRGVAAGSSARKVAKAIAPTLTEAGTDNVRYQSMRIARTELATAYREGHIASVVDAHGNLQPWIEAIGWRLSPAHPRTDICDAWAGDDTEGLGVGNYSPDNVPPGHPHCLCATVSILTSNPSIQFVSRAPLPGDVPEAQRRYYGALRAQ